MKVLGGQRRWQPICLSSHGQCLQAGTRASGCALRPAPALGEDPGAGPMRRDDADPASTPGRSRGGAALELAVGQEGRGAIGEVGRHVRGKTDANAEGRHRILVVAQAIGTQPAVHVRPQGARLLGERQVELLGCRVSGPRRTASGPARHAPTRTAAATRPVAGPRRGPRRPGRARRPAPRGAGTGPRSIRKPARPRPAPPGRRGGPPSSRRRGQGRRSDVQATATSTRACFTEPAWAARCSRIAAAVARAPGRRLPG